MPPTKLPESDEYPRRMPNPCEWFVLKYRPEAGAPFAETALVTTQVGQLRSELPTLKVTLRPFPTVDPDILSGRPSPFKSTIWVKISSFPLSMLKSKPGSTLASVDPESRVWLARSRNRLAVEGERPAPTP